MNYNKPYGLIRKDEKEEEVLRSNVSSFHLLHVLIEVVYSISLFYTHLTGDLIIQSKLRPKYRFSRKLIMSV
jgi:hypothetical protein